MTPNTHRRSVFGILVLAALLGCGGSSKPSSQVEITWDTWGTPHVYAQTDDRLCYGLARAQMRSHGNLILEMYGKARGRAAELWGADDLASDRFVLTMGGVEAAEKAYATLTPAERSTVDSFAAGVNDYAADSGATLSDKAKLALPVTGLDVLQYALYAQFINGIYMTPDLVNGAAQSWGATGVSGASNGWAIGPSRSKSGKPLLLSNTHMPWPNSPFSSHALWFEAQLVGKNVDVYGVGLVGLPALTIGFNDLKAWTITASYLDQSYFYELTLSDDGYLFDGVVKPFERTSHEIKIKQPDGSFTSETLEVRRSVHGPVIAQGNQKALAVRLMLSANAIGTQLWDMARAKNLDEFTAALREPGLMALNTLYADRSGNILYSLTGTMPDRAGQSSPSDLLTAVPGDLSATLWNDYLPYDRFPRILNPSSGFLQNTNDSPWTATHPSALDPTSFPKYWQTFASLRTASSLRILSSRPSFSLADMVADRTSTHSELADRVLGDLLEAAWASASDKVKQAADVLAAWDRRFDADSAGAVLFAFWAMQLQPSILGGMELPASAFRVAKDPARILETPTGLADPAGAVAALEAAAGIVEHSFGSLKAPWGALVHFQVGSLELPGFGAPGESLGAFNVSVGLPQPQGGPLKVIQGDSFVLAVDMADPDNALAIKPYGNATQPGSPHVEDQLRLYASKQMRPVWRTQAQVASHAEFHELFP